MPGELRRVEQVMAEVERLVQRQRKVTAQIRASGNQTGIAGAEAELARLDSLMAEHRAQIEALINKQK